MIKKVHKAGKQLRINLPDFITTDQELNINKGDYLQFSKVKLPTGKPALVLNKVEPISEKIFTQQNRKRNAKWLNH